MRLLRTPSIGPVTYLQLIARFGTPAAAVPDLARRGGGKVPPIRSRDEAEREIAKSSVSGATFLALGQGLYPCLLAELEDAPPLLIAKGNLNLLDRQSAVIVGARNASAGRRAGSLAVWRSILVRTVWWPSRVLLGALTARRMTGRLPPVRSA